jgi:8-oxo-dGTP pyrophosphatase MutT (NUDIX family)
MAEGDKIGGTEIKPWKVERSRTVIKDRWIDLRADDCIRADGVRIAPYYVLNYPEWVHIVCVDKAGRICLVDQYRHGAGKIVRELPGGMLEPSESALACAQRELLEETGLTAEDWAFHGAYSPNPATHTNNIHIFTCVTGDDLRKARSKPDATEQLHAYFAEWEQIEGYIEDGSFSQLSHLGILMRARMAGKLGAAP